MTRAPFDTPATDLSATGLPATGVPFDQLVYVVTDPGVPAYGRKGASSHVQSVLRELTRRLRGGERSSVTLVATRVDGDVPEGLEGVDVIEFGRPRAKDPAVRERMVADLDTRAAEEVERLLASHADPARTLVYQRYSLWSAQVMERASAAGARTVLEVNAPLVEEQATHRVLVDRAGAQETTVRALRAAEVVYAVSSAVAEWAASTAGLAPGAVAAIPNGVDLERFVPAASSNAGHGADEATDSSITEATSDAPPTIAFVGTFRPWHAPDMLVEAAARLQERGTPVRLLLVGEGPMLQDTIDRAAAAGVAVEAVGAVAPARVPELLARADLAAAPYPAGPAYFSPLKVAEYLAAGLPTVASAVADLPRLFSTDEVALVTPGDTDAFTDALARLVTDPAERARLSAAGLAAATDRFGWAAVVDRVLTALERREAA